MSTIYRWGAPLRTLSSRLWFPLSADLALSQVRTGTRQGLLLDSSGATVPNDTSGPKNFFVIDSTALEAGSIKFMNGLAERCPKVRNFPASLRGMDDRSGFTTFMGKGSL
jgi:hypothetical protein